MYQDMLKPTSSLYKVLQEEKMLYPSVTEEQELYREVFLPVLVHFTEWVLCEAEKQNISRLYFLARDGYQYYVLADAICKARKLPIECRYLEGSRFAWRLPEYHILEKDAIEKICIGGIHVTLEKILRRAGLEAQEIIEVAEELQLQDSLEKELSYADTVGLQPVLKESEKLLTFMKLHSREAYALTAEYFKQEGLFENVNYALVDSGWTGSLQQTLTNLLNRYDKKGRKGIKGFYFGLYELPKRAEERFYQAFYFKPWKNLRRKATFSNCLFEAIYTAPAGMTCGYYRREDGRIEAVKETTDNPNLSRINDNLQVLERFAGIYADTVQKGHYDVKQVQKLLTELMYRPDRSEAECLGSYLFSDDVWSSSLQKVAADLTEEEIANQQVINKFLIMTGRKQGLLKNSAWIEGSIAKCDCNIAKYRWHAYVYKWLIYVRKKLKG